MKITDLDAIERQMTPGDWWVSDYDGGFRAGSPGNSVEVGDVDFSGHNNYGVLVLRNHARALIELAMAVGKRKATLCHSVSVHEPQRARECQCSALYAPECPVRAADAAVMAAHAAVEAIA